MQYQYPKDIKAIHLLQDGNRYQYRYQELTGTSTFVILVRYCTAVPVPVPEQARPMLFDTGTVGTGT